MSRIDFCPRCGQPLPPRAREGVYLPARKAAIFDTVHRYPGITAEGIRANCFSDRTTIKTIHVHVNQINDMLAGTDVRIKGEMLGGRESGGYRIVRSKRSGQRTTKARKR